MDRAASQNPVPIRADRALWRRPCHSRSCFFAARCECVDQSACHVLSALVRLGSEALVGMGVLADA